MRFPIARSDAKLRDRPVLEITCPGCGRRQQIVGRPPEPDWAVYCPTCRYCLGNWSDLSEEQAE